MGFLFATSVLNEIHEHVQYKLAQCIQKTLQILRVTFLVYIRCPKPVIERRAAMTLANNTIPTILQNLDFDAWHLLKCRSKYL